MNLDGAQHVVQEVTAGREAENAVLNVVRGPHGGDGHEAVEEHLPERLHTQGVDVRVKAAVLVNNFISDNVCLADRDALLLYDLRVNKARHLPVIRN